ncbi:DNA repair protein RecN (Recombination protein N) [Marivirga sericea]|uniref:DNA repair protein RecN n=1 Tax=Marivirga sericea TaxID=1028 RepID=A0A1X7KBY5_9BACT|nr:DNA repair protein RecN [Marivirga sericea]SMG38331.1 DNA repair protein RecN (Recombination protein N) [Marivirga sericea]
MLQKLLIKNYALIQELNINPSSNLNTITGETGAGKSIMLGAVGLLLGKRADTKVLYSSDTKCVVEGLFDIGEYNLNHFFEREDLDYDTECVIRREISTSGKSRAFINDTPVTLDVLKNLGNHLMDIHSQHETLLIGDQDFQLRIIDAYAGTIEALTKYKSSFSTYTKAKKSLKHFKDTADQMQQEKDFNQFLFDELDKAQLKNNEQEDLEEKLELLENGELIKLKLSEAHQLMDGPELAAIHNLHQATESLKAIQSYGKDFQELSERLNSSFIEIQDISKELEITANEFEHQPEELQQTQERLSLIYSLQQKHHVDSVEALMKIKSDLEGQLLAVQDAEGSELKLQKAVDEAYAQMDQEAQQISKQRIEHFQNLEKELRSLLAGLGMEDAVVKIDNQEKEHDKSGIDDIRILFSANKGVAPQNLKNVASGGEFSRLMFAIKYIMADKIAMPTIIFDEIDTGISGEVAIKMVNMMQKMAENHQVITISHLPQIAAKGDQHYFVYKDNSADKSISKIKLLDEKERSLEIAKMIGGENPSDSAIQSAKELLEH